MKTYSPLAVIMFMATSLYWTTNVFAALYTYDPLNRLTRVAYDNGSSIDYSYDDAGNITQIAMVGNIVPINGVCGNSNGGLFDTAPTSELCDKGSISASGVWNWDCVGQYGGSTVSCSATLGYLLTVDVSGNGNVKSSSTVSGVPSDILCSSGPCSAGYPNGKYVSLTATPDPTATFGGWSGPCVDNPCSVAMNEAKSFSATFNQAPKIKLDVNATTGYTTFAEAYTNTTGALHALQDVLTGDWTLNGNKAIVLKGGYQADYKTRTGYTTIKGKATVKGGSLRVDRVKIQP